MASVSEQLKKRKGVRNQRLRSKYDLAHKPNGHGKGRWHSRTTLWEARGNARRLRKIAAESRRKNRGL
jgi:hypothetical protein